MAKATDKPKTFTPKELSEELDVDAKRIRAFLRGSDYARELEEKNTSWVLTEEMADAVRDRFEPSDDEGEEDVDELVEDEDGDEDEA
jgi:hypothetical protein